jgi:hypothetical protein
VFFEQCAHNGIKLSVEIGGYILALATQLVMDSVHQILAGRR